MFLSLVIKAAIFYNLADKMMTLLVLKFIKSFPPLSLPEDSFYPSFIICLIRAMADSQLFAFESAWSTSFDSCLYQLIHLI